MKKRIDISRLEKNRGSFLLFGFACSLLFVWASFEWVTSDPVPAPFEEESPALSHEIDVVRTFQGPVQPVPLPGPKQISGNIQLVSGSFSATPAPIDPSISADPSDPVWTEPGLPAKVPEGPPPRPVIPEKEAPLIIAEVMPRFPGCEDMGLSKEERQTCSERALLKYVYENVVYPQVALDNGIFGQVVVRFVVEKDGSITEAEVVRDIGGSCGQAVLQVVESMPKWIPGSQQGRKVRVLFKLPVRFEPARE